MAEHERVLGARKAPLLVASKRCTRALSAALLLAASGEAHAQSAPSTPKVLYPPPRVQVFADLTYDRASNALICPDEETFRQRVQARMGIDSFIKNPHGAHVGRVRVQVERTPGGFTASYTWVGVDGATKTERFSMSGASEIRCLYALEEAATSLAGHFALLEAALGAKLARPSKRCPAAEPCPLPVESNYSVWPKEPSMLAPREPPKLPERWPLAVRLGVAAGPEFIAAGWGSLGLSAEVGVRYRFFSAGAELRSDPPLGSRASFGVGDVSFARVSGALVLCAHYGWFVGCGVGDIGRVFFYGTEKLPASTHYAAAGVRTGLEFPVAPPRFFLRMTLDLRAPILVKSYVQKDTTIFQFAGLGVSGGLGFVAELGP